MDIKVCILSNEAPNSGEYWLKACLERGIKADIIDLCSHKALDLIQKGHYDLCLTWPPGLFDVYKSIYDEKLFYVSHILNMPCFPSFKECFVYENKKSAAAYFRAARIPHPQTWVFCYYQEANEFISDIQYPIVAKTSIGASGSGVKIIRSQQEAYKYIQKAFNGRGIKRRFGPNRTMGTPKKWLTKAIRSPRFLADRVRFYFKINRYIQHSFVIFQEYIEHDFEWRIVKVGESFFSHKKIKVKEMASGAKMKEFGFPPEDVLNFVRDLCERERLESVCVDLFESNGSYLVNEIQCVFGIPYGYLSRVDGETGRFLMKEGHWMFDKGDFTKNEACNLKLDTALKLYEEGKL